MAKITYKHKPGDPEETEWHGHTFKSGESIEIDGRRSEHQALIKAAKNNPWFEVDGEAGPEAKKPSDKPETPEEYRAYAIDWINQVKSSRAMQRRWDDEEKMRDELGWGSDDQARLDPIFEPKLEKLKQAEDQR